MLLLHLQKTMDSKIHKWKNNPGIFLSLYKRYTEKKISADDFLCIVRDLENEPHLTFKALIQRKYRLIGRTIKKEVISEKQLMMPFLCIEYKKEKK